MVPSGAAELGQALRTVCVRLTDAIADDPDAVVPAAAELEASRLIGRAVAIITGDEQSRRIVAGDLASGSPTVPPVARPAVLARDLLISATLVADALDQIGSP
jgi:hypothetical protein